jgi:hypothetical protein
MGGLSKCSLPVAAKCGLRSAALQPLPDQIGLKQTSHIVALSLSKYNRKFTALVSDDAFFLADQATTFSIFSKAYHSFFSLSGTKLAT